MLYLKDELVLMLERASGFADVSVRGPCNDAPPKPDDDFLSSTLTESRMR